MWLESANLQVIVNFPLKIVPEVSSNKSAEFAKTFPALTVHSGSIGFFNTMFGMNA